LDGRQEGRGGGLKYGGSPGEIMQSRYALTSSGFLGSRQARVHEPRTRGKYESMSDDETSFN